MSGKVYTTGDLRNFLCAAIVAVEEGQLDLEKARQIAKLASQINDSFYAEIKAVQVLARENQAIPQLELLLPHSQV